jgi:hypothetical protein
MPVAPVFPTGTTGGANDIVTGFTEAKLDDGSWTFTDTTGLIDSYSWSVAGNEITLANFPVADNNNQITGNAGTVTAPYWAKLAYYDDGTPVLSDDCFILWVSADLIGSTAGILRYFNWGLGTCINTTSTSVTTVKFNGVGAGWNFANLDADVFGKLYSGGTSPATGAFATDTHILGNLFLSGNNYTMSVIATSATDVYVTSSAATNSITNMVGSNHLQLRFVCGPNGTTRTFALGDQTVVKLYYKFQKIDKASAGF